MLSGSLCQNLRNESDIERSINIRRCYRVQQIINKKVYANIADGSKIFFHIVPINNTTIPISFEIMHQLDIIRLPFNSNPGFRINFDGYNSAAIDSYDKNKIKGNIQIFHDGLLEIFDTLPSHFIETQTIYIAPLEEVIINNINIILRAFNILKISPPFLILPSITSVLGYKFSRGPIYDMGVSFIDKNDLMFNIISIEQNIQESVQILRPFFDQLWQAGGYPRSLHYNEQGDWQRPRY